MTHKMKWTSLAAGILALILLVSSAGQFAPAPVQAASSAELEKQLEELKGQKGSLDSQISNLKSQISANMNAMEKLVTQKEIIDQEISLLRQKVDLTNSEISAYSLLIADKQDELDTAQLRLETLQEENKMRIRAMEKNSRVSFWSVLFSSNTFMEYLDRMKMIEEIREEDNRRLQEMKEVAQSVSQAKLSLEEKQAQLKSTLSELDQMQVQLDTKRQEADDILIELKAKGDELDAYLEESEDKQDQLMKDMANLKDDIEDAKYLEWLATSDPNGDPPGGNVVDGISWYKPCSYWVLTSPFGMRKHPISGKYKMHNGVDLAGARGTPIKATRSGRVDTAAYQKGGAGHYVQINHGDGFKSIYMHMTNYIVKVGQYVKAGEVIGYMGNSGGSTGVHLHFGISYKGTYVNPVKYVNLK